MTIPEATSMGRIARLCDQTVTPPAEEESTFRGTFAPEQGRARVPFSHRPALIRLSDSAQLRHTLGLSKDSVLAIAREKFAPTDLVIYRGNRGFVVVDAFVAYMQGEDQD